MINNYFAGQRSFYCAVLFFSTKIISFLLLLILSSFILQGCSSSVEPFEEKSYTADIEIHEINLNVKDREIEVSLSEDGKVHIQYSDNSKEYYNISVSSGNVLTMEAVSAKGWTDYIGVKPPAKARKISIQVPDALLENITLSTTNEDISLASITVTGNISFSVNGGNIAFGNLYIGEALYLTVKNGDIAGTVTGGYDDFAIHSEVKKGKSNLPDNKNGGEKTLNVSCNNGDINIEFVN